MREMIRRSAIAVEGSLAAGALGAGALGAAFAARFGGAAPAALLLSATVAGVVVLTMHDTRNAILAVFATFPVAGAASGLPLLQVTEAATLTFGLLVALVMLAAGEMPLGWSPRLVWGVALLAWTLIALPTAVDETLALKQVAQLVAGLVFVSVLLRVCRSSDDVRRVLAAFVGIALTVTAFGLASGGASALRPALEGATAQGRLRATFDQPNQFGAFAAMTALVALALAVGARTRRGRAAAAVACVLILPGLLLSLSRGGWIGFGLGLCAVVATVARSRRAVLASVPVLALVIGLLASTASFGSDLGTIRLRAEALTVRSPYDHRDVIYTEAWREIRTEPWTGVGPGGFPVASARGASEAATTRALHAHNLLLTWAAECGLPAAAIIAAFAVSLAGAVRRTARAAVRQGSEADRGLALGLGAVLLSVLGQGMVDYVFRNEVLFLSLWMVIGALLAHERAVRMQ